MPTHPHPHRHPAPTPAPVPAPSPTTAPELIWVYPFPDRDEGQGHHPKEMTDPQQCYEALSYMDDGFFPLGVNGFPHGGVHFGNATASRFDQASGMRCIADGEIVAYRVNAGYEHLQYADGKWAAYSTGFVLVRHAMTMPPAPDSTGPQPADETHDVYSLYMHMADWATYLADVKRQRPFWWDVDAFAMLDKDHQQPAPEGGPAGAAGAFVWTAPKAGKKKGHYSAGQQVGFLPEGSEVIVSEKRGEWVHIQTITAGAMCSATTGGTFGWEDKNVPWAVPDGGRADAPVTPRGDWGWLHLPGLQPTKEPKQLGQVVIPHPPLPVKAKTLLGQIGEYQDYERANPLPPTPRRSLLHLEVFADDSFSTFLTACRTRAALLPTEQRTLLAIDAGTTLVLSAAVANTKLGPYWPVTKVAPVEGSPASGPWVNVRAIPGGLYEGREDPGPPVWIERESLANPTADTPAWSTFPLILQNAAEPASGFPVIYSRGQLDAQGARDKATDNQGMAWWRVSFCTADGKKASGWVRETGHPGTTWQSPWAWPGFDIVDATGIDLADAFKRNLVITDAVDWKERHDFEPSAAAVNNSPLLLKLEQAVAKEDPEEQSGRQNSEPTAKVTARAIQASMRLPALAQALSHVILRYESEWGGNMSRWEALTPLMRSAKANWLKELERIKKLQWWDDVRDKIGGFPRSATVLHMHPIALVANFMCNCNCINIDAFLQTYEAEHVLFEPDTQPLDATSKNNLRIFIQGVLDFNKKYKNGECNIPYIAYMLGTARLETKKYHADQHKTIYFEPTTEGGSTSYFDKYDPVLADTAAHRQRAINNGNTDQGDGYKYRGRGYVQVTWKNNYQAFGRVINVDLVNSPDRMLEPKIAAWATVYGMENGIFTRKKLSDYINQTAQDYVNARRIINGLDQADKIAGFAIKYKLILEASKC